MAAPQRKSPAWHDIVRTHLRAILPIGGAVLIALPILFILLIGYVRLIGDVAAAQLAAFASTREGASVTVIGLMVPVLLTTLLVCLVWAGVVAQVAAAKVTNRRADLGRAAAGGFTQAPRVFLAALLIVLGVVGAVVAAPVLTVAGVAGLIAEAIARRPIGLARWPQRTTLVTMAIPFGFAAHLITRWALVLPVIWIERLGIKAAFRASAQASRTRELGIGLTLLITATVTVLLSEGAAWLVGLAQGGPLVETAVRLAAVIAVGPLVLVGMTVWWFRYAPMRSASAEERAPRRLGRSRIAVATSIAVVLPLAIVGAPTPAYAFATTTTLQVAPDTSVYRQNVTLTATVAGESAPDGFVSFVAGMPNGNTLDVGRSPVVGGVATLVTDQLPVGTYQLQAFYEGFTFADPSVSNTVPYEVTRGGVAVTIVSNPTEPAANGTAEFLITVAAAAPAAGIPSGFVQLYRDNVVYGSPIELTGSGYQYTTVNIGAGGPRSFRAEYAGDDRFAPGSGQIDFTVRIPTTTAVEGEANRSHIYGDTQTYAGTVTAEGGSIPTGTVELFYGGQAVPGTSQALTAAGTFSIVTDQIPVLNVLTADAWVVYTPDAAFEPSDSSGPDTVVHLEMKARNLVPQLSAAPAPYEIGDDITVTATLAHSGGNAPAGAIRFWIGSVPLTLDLPLVNGSVTLPFHITAQTTTITAKYNSPDANYADTEGTIVLNAGKPVPQVTLDDPGPITYGSTGYFVAHVAIDGLTPTGSVQFRTSANATYTAPIGPDGSASLEVCAGFAGDCESGVPLGTGDLTITAIYGATAVNLEGQSSPVSYTVPQAPTTITVTANPSTVLQGSLVELRAFVDVPGTTLEVTSGSVAFYGLNPDGTESFVGRDDTIVGGLATVQPKLGAGSADLRWPAYAIVARYTPLGSGLAASNGQTPITLLRQGLDLAIDEPTIIPGQSKVVTIRLNHEPGTSDPYTERVTLLVDGVVACREPVIAPNQFLTCTVPASMLGTGSHDLQATYPGDVVYKPGSSAVLTVGVGKRTPNLGASIPFPVIAGATITVTWGVFDPNSTGTVSVLTPEGEWCTNVPVTQGQCSGTIETPSPPAEFTNVRVRFFGDDNWNQTEQTVFTRVDRCAPLDVYTDTSSLGSVRIDTPSNCTIPSSGAPGYLAGTTVTATATPNPSVELDRWRTLSGSTASTSATVTWLVTNDSTSWVRIASFRVPCYSIEENISGSGRFGMIPASNCTTPAGAPGWTIGTTVAVYPVGTQGPAMDEPDEFVEFTHLPPGATVGNDALGAPRALVTMTADVMLAADFTVRCRVITVLVDPASEEGDRTEILTEKKCTNWAQSGYFRGEDVTVTASSGDPKKVLASWSVDGVVQPSLGREATATFRVDGIDPVITANFVDCYTVTIDLDSVTVNGNDIGRVDLSAPTCPDGSDRYLPGSTVTLSPVVLADGASFRGWDPTQTTYFIVAKGPVKGGEKTITVDADLSVYAGFFTPDSCSSIRFLGKNATSILSFPKDGCGPGYYFDLQKVEAKRAGIVGSEALHDFKYRSALIASVPEKVKMDVYVSFNGGDAKNCFGVADPGIADGWQTFGPLTREFDSCDIGGDLTVWVEQCQTIDWDLQFMRDGQLYRAIDMPSMMYLPGADGKIGAFTTEGFNWLESAQGTVADNQFVYEELDPGPCASAGNAYPAGRDVGIYPMSPTAGVAFAGWGNLFEDGSLLPSAPMVRTTTESRKMTITAVYEVTCYHLTLGPGIAVEGDAPWCPGYDPSAMMFVGGTAVQVKGDGVRDDDGRQLMGLLNDFVNGQTWNDDFGNQFGFVFMNGDKTVRGDYVTKAQMFGRGVAQGLKFVAGVAAVAAPILLGMAFPPVGIALAALGAAAGLMSLLPGKDPNAGFFDLINPANITQCIAKWAFNNPDQPKDGVNYGAQVATINNIKNIITKPDVFIAPIADLRTLPIIGGKLPKSIANLPGGLSFAIGGAAFGYGLYDAGIGRADLGPQTIEELNDTGTITSCLDEQWRFARSDLNLGPGEQKAP